jgi:hypothetical protein
MQPLSTEARARLAAFRSAESPDRAIAERCLVALEQRLDEAADDGPAAGPPPRLEAVDDGPAGPPRRRLAAPLAVAIALAASVLLALTWAVTRGVSAPRSDMAAAYQSHDDPRQHVALPRTPEPSPRASARFTAPARAPEAPEEPAAVVDEPVPPDTIDESPVQEAPVPSDTIESPAAVPEAPVPADSSKPTARRPVQAEDMVAVEVALLRRAKLAEPNSRLALLKEHARRFPTGLLAAERELLVIETRCALDEVETARHLAERFMRRFAGSPLVERAATICGGPDGGL